MINGTILPFNFNRISPFFTGAALAFSFEAAGSEIVGQGLLLATGLLT